VIVSGIKGIVCNLLLIGVWAENNIFLAKEGELSFNPLVTTTTFFSQFYSNSQELLSWVKKEFHYFVFRFFSPVKKLQCIQISQL